MSVEELFDPDAAARPSARRSRRPAATRCWPSAASTREGGCRARRWPPAGTRRPCRPSKPHLARGDVVVHNHPSGQAGAQHPGLRRRLPAGQPGRRLLHRGQRGAPGLRRGRADPGEADPAPGRRPAVGAAAAGGELAAHLPGFRGAGEPGADAGVRGRGLQPRGAARRGGGHRGGQVPGLPDPRLPVGAGQRGAGGGVHGHDQPAAAAGGQGHPRGGPPAGPRPRLTIW